MKTSQLLPKLGNKLRTELRQVADPGKSLAMQACMNSTDPGEIRCYVERNQTRLSALSRLEAIKNIGRADIG